ncbi:MAG TPA: 50S ribosomal protein L25, partial [Planctomycetota bacterium]|nr:50S ribosomal protein L25 [Planctomycetota bacterium]
MSTRLNAERRERTGTRHSRSLREEGRIPAVLQGGGKPNLEVSIPEEEFLTTRRRHEHLYDLELDGESETALVNQLAWDVFGERILHVEFRRVDRTRKTDVEVELEFVGHPKGVLNHMITHVAVHALPTEIPDALEVSVADLQPGTTIMAGEIKLPKNVELAIPPETPVARISAHKVEVEAAPAAPETAAAPSAAAPAEAPPKAGA